MDADIPRNNNLKSLIKTKNVGTVSFDRIMNSLEHKLINMNIIVITSFTFFVVIRDVKIF